MATTTLSNIPDSPGTSSSLSSGGTLKKNSFADANGDTGNGGDGTNVSLEVKLSTSEPNNEGGHSDEGFTG